MRRSSRSWPRSSRSTTTLGVAGAKAATLRRTPWSARSRTCRRSYLNTVGRLTCSAHHPVVVSRWRRRRRGSRSTGSRCTRCRTPWPRTGRSGTSETSPRSRNCSPTAAAETWSSSSYARSDRPRKTSRERGARPSGSLWRLSRTRSPTTRPAWERVPPPTARLARITQPTLVATGGGTPDAHAGGLPSGFMDRAADAIAASIPQAERQVIAGHTVDAKLVAPVLERFFGR
jgi:hypothetical protein